MLALKRLRIEFPAFDLLLKTIESTVVQSVKSGPDHIVTHSGTFHCDEALACALLKSLPEYKDKPICRTRDNQLIDAGGLVVDVGAIFEVERKRFDHHQRGFTECFNSNKKIKLSSAGLIYKYYGKNILKSLLPENFHNYVDVLYLKLYEDFIEHIDGIDNGVESYENGEKNYRVTTTLSSRVSRLFPRKDSGDKNEENERFREAMELTATEFCDSLNYLVQEWLPARSSVQLAMEKATSIHPTGDILKLDQSLPWKGHLIELEGYLNCKGKFKFVLFPDGTNWRVQAIPPVGDPEGFGMRVPLKKEWQGLRDEELSKASGIPDCIFVHATGFIGGNKTYQGALEMALKSVEASGQNN